MNDTDNDWRIDAMYAANLKNWFFILCPYIH